MKKKIKIVSIILVLFLVAAMILYPRFKGSSVDEPSQSPAASSASSSKNRQIHVEGLVLRPETIAEKIYSTGTILADESVDLSFETSGKITDIFFKEGSFVKEGTVLAKVNDKPLQAQLRSFVAQLPLAEERVRRQKTLLERDAVSQEAYEEVATQLDKLLADIDYVEAQIALTELKAPFNGYVGLRNVSEGAYATPSLVVTRLTKITPLKVDFSIPERYAKRLERGAKITFRVDGIDRDFEAQVYAFDSAIDPNTRTLGVRALYPNLRGELSAGNFVSVEVNLSEIRNALTVPTQSIVPEMGIDKVFLYKSGVATPVPVVLGLRTESTVQVLKGLEVGDTLVTSGVLQMRQGSPLILDSVK